ncbi:MAG: M1 family metallopeptidase [Bryobacteraceae bacterium]|nr:M1 family metallopeptidase [Bryobacteraceae bacterium]
MQFRHIVLTGALLLTVSCKGPVQTNNESNKYRDPHDYHSWSNPDQIRVKHVALDLEVLFTEKTLRGTATLAVERQGDKRDSPLILDSRDLKILSVESSADGKKYSPVQFQIGTADPILGAPFTIQVPESVSQVRIAYQTSPGAAALQWLTPQQTTGKAHPFLYTQSEPIYARSWIPLQDSPGVRVTYSAHIKTPKALVAAMSAKNEQSPAPTGDYKFTMQQAIPSYLIALAVGNLEYRPISQRTGVYAEPSVLPRAAKEFEDMEKMIQAAERLYGAYQWEQFDVLILPPSFPYGGMENPRLTFLTPTLLAGDKSLVGVVSHELAHSWSGNLVTNATWRDFWLNEGFTTYFERRIQEEVYGAARGEMEALLEVRDLDREMKQLSPQDQLLYIDLKGRDPELGSTLVPYVKGMLLLRRLEELYGRDRFDGFLRSYFGHFAFKSITTGDFVSYLDEHLIASDRSLETKIGLDDWLSRPGLPATAPKPKSAALDEAGKHASNWLGGKEQLTSIDVSKWSAQEWQQFLTSMPVELDRAKMAELDKAYGFTKSGNAEIKFQWLLMAIRSKYDAAYNELGRFLVEVGRRKYIRPLYQELAKRPEDLKRARAIYARARPGYHPIAVATVDEILKQGKQ